MVDLKEITNVACVRGRARILIMGSVVPRSFCLDSIFALENSLDMYKYLIMNLVRTKTYYKFHDKFRTRKFQLLARLSVCNDVFQQ